ncbi:MAG: hypothetical protein GF347_04375 [Candidatus Moranbacteria bacterium]|nr:hypothetical protein [Candidatus Moranbacteria bacterium]
MRNTTDMKIKFLGIIPQYKTRNLNLSPQEIAAFSGLLTFKGDSVEDLIDEAQRKHQDITKKVKLILRKSSLRGHASMATMPVFCFSFEASKMLGSMLTGITHSSALMHSGRRAEVSKAHNVCPAAIFKNFEAKELYEKASNLNIKVFNDLLKLGVIKDEAGKILHYGTYGTGIITLPAESLATFAREYELEKKWMPEEGGILLKAIEKEMRGLGIDLLFATRDAAPKNTYPYPNLFKDPKRNHLVRDIKADFGTEEDEVRVFNVDALLGRGFKERVNEIKKYQEELFLEKEKLRKNWRKLLDLKRKLVRDYQNAVNVKTLSNVSWRVWRDKKRHRTAPVTTESIYYCIDRAWSVIKKHEKDFNKKARLSEDALDEIDKVFAIPSKLRLKEKTLKLYMRALFTSMKAYNDLLKLGIKEKDAVFVIPRAIRIDMVQEYNLYNLVDGYYQLRSCPTADEQIFRQTKEEIRQLKEILDYKGLKELSYLIQPKCVNAGFCPEEETCGFILGFVDGYDSKFHAEMKEDLEKGFKERLGKINKG